MKKKKFLVLLFAAMTVFMVSCKKDKFVDVELPSVSEIFTYIGMDAEAVKTAIQSKGFELSDDYPTHIGLLKGEVDEGDDFEEYYALGVNKNTKKVTDVYYELEGAIGMMTAVNGKSPISGNAKDMLAQEKEFRVQSSMTQYFGYIITEKNEGNQDSVAYTDKEQFISAVNNLEFKYLVIAKSTSTYPDASTIISIEFEKVGIKVE